MMNQRKIRIIDWMTTIGSGLLTFFLAWIVIGSKTMKSQYSKSVMTCGLFFFFSLPFYTACVDEQVNEKRMSNTEVSVESLMEIRVGMSSADIAGILEGKGFHQFTASISEAEVRCLAYYRSGVYSKVYFTFKDDQLFLVSYPPPFEMERVLYQGVWLNRRVVDDPEDRLQKVLLSHNIIGPDLVAALKPMKAPKHRSDPGLTAAYILNRMFADRKGDVEAGKIYSTLVDRFDPFQIDLGMTLDNAEARLGYPNIIETVEG